MNPGTSLSAGVETACETIRQAIKDGRFPPGSRITEVEVCRLGKVSRSSVRQALTLLAAEGFVELRANKGATVVEWNDESLYEIFDLRALLEGYGCALAARHATQAEIDALREEAARFDALAKAAEIDTRAVAESNNRFHRLLLEAGRNSRIASLLTAVVHVPLERLTFAKYERATFLRSAQQHHDLVDAIAARDPVWAETAMRAHIHAAKFTIFGAREEAPAPQPAPKKRRAGKP